MNHIVEQDIKIETSLYRLGDILSQGQIVPTAFLGRQIVPSDKMSHFLPRDKLSHQTNCPISSPETKCPTDALIKNHCSTGIFRETNCPIRQIVPLSPRRQNVPNYSLMHRMQPEYVQYMSPKCATFAQGIGLQIDKVGQLTKCPNNFPATFRCIIA